MGKYQSKNLAKAILITKKLEEKNAITFIRVNDKYRKTHTAIVSDGLVVVDKKHKMTWDSFTYLYLLGF